MSPHLFFLCSSFFRRVKGGRSSLFSHAAITALTYECVCERVCVRKRDKESACGAGRCIFALFRLSIYDFIVKTLHVLGLCDHEVLQHFNAPTEPSPCLILPPCGQLEVRHFLLQ